MGQVAQHDIEHTRYSLENQHKGEQSDKKSISLHIIANKNVVFHNIIIIINEYLKKIKYAKYYTKDIRDGNTVVYHTAIDSTVDLLEILLDGG